MDGGATFAEGMPGIEKGMTTFPDGMAEIEKGMTTFPDGMAGIEKGMATFPDGGAEIADGTATIAKGGTTFFNGMAPTGEGAGLPTRKPCPFRRRGTICRAGGRREPSGRGERGVMAAHGGVKMASDRQTKAGGVCDRLFCLALEKVSETIPVLR